MSVKRSQKVQKRTKKKQQQAKQQRANAAKRQQRMVGRLDLKKVTPTDQALATMMSDDVPESEWHPDDVATIKEQLEKSKRPSEKSKQQLKQY